MFRFFARYFEDESGATAIEYGLIIGLMALVILTALTAFANNSTGVFNTAMNKVRDAVSGPSE